MKIIMMTACLFLFGCHSEKSLDLKVGDCIRRTQYSGLGYLLYAPSRILEIGSNTVVIETLDSSGNSLALSSLWKDLLTEGNYEKLPCPPLVK